MRHVREETVATWEESHIEEWIRYDDKVIA